MPADVSCVVVAYHRPQSLARLLSALRRPAVEIVVVNVDGDAVVAAACAEGDVVVPLSGNPGYAAAVNTGAARATAPVVAFMNDDLVVDGATVVDMAAVVSAGQADVVVPLVLDGRGRPERTIAPLVTPATLLREWCLLPDRPIPLLQHRRAVEKWRLPEGREPVVAATAAMVVAGAGLLRAHPLPEAYFMYWEESEWFWHLRRAGARVVYDPTFTCRHEGGRADVRAAKSRLLARNAVRCVARTQGAWAAAAAWAVVVVWNLRLLVADAVRAACRQAGRQQVAARAAGLSAALGSWREVWSTGSTESPGSASAPTSAGRARRG